MVWNREISLPGTLREPPKTSSSKPSAMGHYVKCRNCGTSVLRTLSNRHLVDCPGTRSRKPGRNDGIFQCKVGDCQEVFKTKEQRTKHAFSDHSDPIQCPHGRCTSIVAEMTLTRHLAEAHKSTRIKCAQCNNEVAIAKWDLHRAQCQSRKNLASTAQPLKENKPPGSLDPGLVKYPCADLIFFKPPVVGFKIPKKPSASGTATRKHDDKVLELSTEEDWDDEIQRAAEQIESKTKPEPKPNGAILETTSQDQTLTETESDSEFQSAHSIGGPKKRSRLVMDSSMSSDQLDSGPESEVEIKRSQKRPASILNIDSNNFATPKEKRPARSKSKSVRFADETFKSETESPAAPVKFAKPGLPCLMPGCDKLFKSLSTRTAHIKSVHSVPIKCPLKGCTDLIKRASIPSHMRNVHGKTEVECGNCGATVPTTDVNRHWKNCTSIGSRNFKCPEPKCDAMFKTAIDRSRHVLDVHQVAVQKKSRKKQAGASRPPTKAYSLRGATNTAGGDAEGHGEESPPATKSGHANVTNSGESPNVGSPIGNCLSDQCKTLPDSYTIVTTSPDKKSRGIIKIYNGEESDNQLVGIYRRNEYAVRPSFRTILDRLQRPCNRCHKVILKGSLELHQTVCF